MEGKSNDKETISKSQQNNQQITKINKEQDDFYKTNNEELVNISSASIIKKNELISNSTETPEEAAISHLKSYKLYVDAKEYLKTEGPRLCRKIGSIYNIEIYKKDEETAYHLNVDLKNRPGSIKIGKNPDAEATIITKDEVLADIISKKLHPATALVQRKVLVKGKLSAIVKFKPEFFGVKPKL